MTRAGLLTILLALSSGPAAAELRHEVKPGESLGEISKAYYGDARHSELIRFYNGLDSSSLRAGKQLCIPRVENHTVTAGNSWSALALRYWGNAALHRQLALHTTGRSDAPLKVGQKLRIAPIIRYRLRAGETLAAVSRRFYGQPGRAGELARFNGVKHPRRLQVGAKLYVLIEELGSVPAAPAQEKAVTLAPPKLEQALQRVINTQLDGRYDDALAQLEALRPKILAEGSRSQQVRLLEQLTFVYAALDRPKDACSGYRALLQLKPELDWDGDRVSPKILSLVARCQGG